MASSWHILGAGAIGCLFAGALQQAGCVCTLVRRSAAGDDTTAATTARLKITAQGSTREFHAPQSLADDPSRISHLLVTTKAYDARAAVASVAHRLDEHTEILLMVNGMGVLEELETDHPHLTIHCGTTTEGAYRTADNDVVHAGKGLTRIGAGRQSDGKQPSWFAEWDSTSLACAWEPDIQSAMWQKLAVNCAINPLTAIHRCKNGELLSSPGITAELEALCDEIAVVCTATGRTDIAENLHKTVRKVILGTADNRSSMLQDVLAGRPTEIAYISGYLTDMARKLGVSTPINHRLLADISRASR